MASSVTIAAIGLVSSVGRGAAGSCAAIRAGVNRSSGIAHFSVADDDSQTAVPLSGHPIVGVTDGLGPSARWLVMCQYALSDLLDSQPALEGAGASFWSRCGIVFVLPVLNDSRFFYAPPARPESVWRSCLDPFIAERMPSLDATHRALVSIGAGGIGSALSLATRWLESNQLERVLVIAVDSLIDAWSLGWLEESARLKHPAHPVGVMPGEGAAALLLEASWSQSGLSPQARATAIAFLEDDQPFQNAERQQGRALAEVLRGALSQTPSAFDGDVYVNLNGEQWRAAEFGTAWTTIPAARIGNTRIHTPAASLGDVGAAAGAVHIVCALRSFARGYSTGRRAWILSTSDYGDASAICVEAC